MLQVGALYVMEDDEQNPDMFPKRCEAFIYLDALRRFTATLIFRVCDGE